jgi:hypothetical protein
MKRIDIEYGGRLYSIGGRTPEDVTAEIESALAAGSGWLRANDGEGAPRESMLLISPGVSLSVIPIPGD